jgi:hypothetical protein
MRINERQPDRWPSQTAARHGTRRTVPLNGPARTGGTYSGAFAVGAGLVRWDDLDVLAADRVANLAGSLCGFSPYRDLLGDVRVLFDHRNLVGLMHLDDALLELNSVRAAGRCRSKRLTAISVNGRG